MSFLYFSGTKSLKILLYIYVSGVIPIPPNSSKQLLSKPTRITPMNTPIESGKELPEGTTIVLPEVPSLPQIDPGEPETEPFDVFHDFNNVGPSPNIHSSKELAEAFLGEKLTYSLSELMKLETKEENELWEPYFPQSGLAALVGRPDCGKAMLARQLSVSIAAGSTRFLGRRLNLRSKSAIYVSTEDSLRTNCEVLLRQATGSMDYANSNFSKLFGNLRFIPFETLSVQELLDELDRQLSYHPADLVVIDSFGDVFDGKDGNNNMEVRKALKPFYALAAMHDTLILFVAHLNKAAYSAKPDQAHVQGAAAFVQKTRTVLDLRLDPKPGYRLLSATKGNRIPQSVKQNALRLEFDESLLTFSDTGELVSVEAIGTEQQKVTQGIEIDWNTIWIPGTKEMTRAQLVDRLHEAYGLQDRQARNYIYRTLKQTKRGHYAKPEIEVAELEAIG